MTRLYTAILEQRHYPEDEVITTQGLLPDGREFRFVISEHAVALAISGDEHPTVTQRRAGRSWSQQARDQVQVIEMLEAME